MTAEQFVFWLQGFFEISGTDKVTLNNIQIKIIRDHIDLVLKKVTPDRREQKYCKDAAARQAQWNGIQPFPFDKLECFKNLIDGGKLEQMPEQFIC